MIFFYSAWASRFAALHPLVLGTCRFANFLLGMRCLPVRLWWMPAVVGVSAGLITFLSRYKVDDPARQPDTRWMLLVLIVVDAIVVVFSPFGDWIGALLVLSLLVPALVLGKVLATS